MDTNFSIMGSRTSQIFATYSEKPIYEKKVHVRGTIMRKPLSFVKNGSGIVFRGYLGLFNENKKIVQYPLPLVENHCFVTPKTQNFHLRAFSEELARQI